MLHIEFKLGSRGNLLMVVRFDENDNFDPDDLTWVPTDEEFDEINETRNSLE